MTQISGSTLPTDDTGDNASGTTINRAFFAALETDINGLIHSTANPTVTPANIIDEVVTARGNKASLNARIGSVIDPNGVFIGSPGNNPDTFITLGASAALRNVLYMSDGTDARTAGRWYPLDASMPRNAPLAICNQAGSAGNQVGARIGGYVTGFAGLAAGTLYYADPTVPGGITNTAPALNPVVVGRADSATIMQLMLFNGFVGSVYRNATSVSSSTGGIIKATGDITVKANTLDITGRGLRFTSKGFSLANVNNKRMIAYFGGSTIFDTGVYTAGGVAHHWKFVIELIRLTANSVHCSTVLHSGPATAGNFANVISVLQDAYTIAKDCTIDEIFKIEFSTAIANGDLVHLDTIGELM